MEKQFKKLPGNSSIAGSILASSTMSMHPAGGSLAATAGKKSVFMFSHALAFICFPFIAFGYLGSDTVVVIKSNAPFLAFAASCFGLVAVLLNSMIKKSLLTAFIFFSFCQSKTFAQHTVIPLYAGEIPNSKLIPKSYRENLDTNGLFTNISVPTLTVFTPKKGTANGTAVIILPSGGYRVLVDEGSDFARAFTSNGITAFVLKYRLPSDEIMKDKAIGPLQDAQMAIKLVRMNAAKYHLDTTKIGFAGISAGGHLATTAATHPDAVLIDNKEKINLRPDFMILVYPVISFTQYKVNATVARLLGETPSEDSLNFFSNERHVTSNTPPTFLLHAGDDARVAVQHSILFYEALQKAGVKSALHILQNGGHGFGLEHETMGNKWFSWCIDWLKDNGFGIPKKNKIHHLSNW